MFQEMLWSDLAEGDYSEATAINGLAFLFWNLNYVIIPTLRLLVALAYLPYLFLDRTGGATTSTNVGPLVPSPEQGGDGTARNVLVTCAENARGSQKDGLRASRSRNQRSSLSPPLKSQIRNDMRVPSVITARCVQSSGHDSNAVVVKM